MLTQEQRVARRGRLGSSDAAAIANRNPPGWPNAYDVWAEKTGKVPLDDTEDTATALGNYLEPAVLQWTQDYLGTEIGGAEYVVHPNGFMAANLDAVAPLHEPPAIIEAKTSGLLARPQFWQEWGEHGTDEIPAHILLQVHHQFAVWEGHRAVPLGMDLPQAWSADLRPPEIRLAFVPVLLGGRGFAMYRVERSEALMAVLLEVEEKFWRDYVQADTPPPAVLPGLETLRRLTRTEGKTVALAPELVREWQTAKANLQGWEKTEEGARARLLTALGDAEAGECELGTVSYKVVNRAGYEVKATSYRRLAFKKVKTDGDK